MSNIQDRKSGLPSEEPHDELEEALKWLEELTNRKGVAPEPPAPTPSATLDSPFHGLIEDDKGDLPDWLREAPSTQNLADITESEPESRLDWLAKMAQRESIEELPTLEWRRIGGPMQSAILPPPREEIAEGAKPAVPVVEPAPEPTESSATHEPGEPLSWFGSIGQETVISDSIDAPPTDEEQESESPGLEMEFSPEDELPSADDLDAAMAWIEELAASQDAPIEDIPSVVDRALASKLMMETEGIHHVSPLDELGSDSDLIGETPIHPFIEEEDLADTVVLVETIAADQRASAEMPDMKAKTLEPELVEPSATAEPGAYETVVDSVTDEPGDLPGLSPSDDLSFEEAMAYLDEIATGQTADLESTGTDDTAVAPFDAAIATGTLEPLPVEEAATSGLVVDEFDSISQLAAEAKELAADDIVPFVEDERSDSEPFEPMGWVDGEAGRIEVEEAPPPLEIALLALDTIALTGGEALGDVDFSPRATQATPSRDIASALDWLESTLAGEPAQAIAPDETRDEADLIAQMPDDPDAILAWLDRMVENETGTPQPVATTESDSTPYVSSPDSVEPFTEDLVAADLLSMPDDPDEAMAWLEGLARGGVEPGGETADEKIETIVDEPVIVTEEWPEETEGELEEIAAGAAEIMAEEIETPIIETAAAPAEAVDEAVIDPVAAAMEEIEAMADEILAVARGPIEEIETEIETEIELAPEDLLSSDAPDMELPEAEAFAPEASVAVDLATEPAAESQARSRPPRAKQRRARTTKVKVGEIAVEAPPPIKEQPDLSWIDLLKPLN